MKLQPKDSPPAPVAGAAAAPLRLQAMAAGDSAAGDTVARLLLGLDRRPGLRAALPRLREAVAALKQEDWPQAERAAGAAVKLDAGSSYGWHMLAIARDKQGALPAALEAYEKAFQLDPANPDIVNNLGRMAYRLKMLPQAEALFVHYLSQKPGMIDAINNLACVLRDQMRYDDAVEFLKPAIAEAPGEASLWNTLGTVLADSGEMASATVFLDEALRLNPRHAKARYNRATARLALGDAPAAVEDCEAAIAGAETPDDLAMMRFARATMLLASGDLTQGWEAYEARFDPHYTDPPSFLTDRPRWAPGDDLAGKRLLLIGEQGLGDEVMFAGMLPDIIEAVGDGQVTLAVEKRLVPLFARSFPEVAVGAHVTTRRHGRILRAAPFVRDWPAVDLWSPLASPLRRFRVGIEAYPERPQGFLKADPERIAYWRGVLARELPAGPKIGLLWASLLINSARNRYFAPFGAWAEALRTPGAVFVNMQYGDCAAEIAHAREVWGVEVWTPPGIDLKQDLDDIAALSCALDITVGPANATSNIAAACGAPVWMIATPGAWPLLGTLRHPWYSQVRIFLPPAFGDWTAAMGEMAAALADLVTGTQAA
ncbi:MAG: tetratricopeptide repeat protein [Caulobacteraceae bacterium]|nr:tetratricopeptide repeat protein [Caulobacteraceae bacterium]